MSSKSLEIFIDNLIENQKCNSEDKDSIIYGIYVATGYIFNLITTLFLGFIFGMVIESLLFLLSFSFIRIYSGGYHCQKARNCYLLSSGIVILALALIKFTPKEYMLIICIIMLFISIPIILRLAPMESPNKPLDNAEKEHYRKKTIHHLFIECILIVGLFLLELHNIAYVVSIGVILSAILLVWQKKLS